MTQISFNALANELGYSKVTLTILRHKGDINEQQYERMKKNIIEIQDLFDNMTQKYGSGYVDVEL